MSIFRPHKTKPRQFNYTPRYYDPVKEAFNQRRKELHGTSSETDDLPYSPGDYLRVKSQARRDSREEQARASSNRLLRYGILIVAVGLGFAVVMPHVVGIMTRFMNAGEISESTPQMTMSSVDAMPVDSIAAPQTITLIEQHGDIDFREFESLTPETVSEIEEWNRQNHTITIYDDDVEIKDGKRVQKSE